MFSQPVSIPKMIGAAALVILQLVAVYAEPRIII
jgi:hypothetical protein